MYISEKIKKCEEKYLAGTATEEEALIAIAYLFGKEDGVIEQSNLTNKVFSKQIARATACRYHKMAMEVQGNIKYVHNFEYSAAEHEIWAGIEVDKLKDEYTLLKNAE